MARPRLRADIAVLGRLADHEGRALNVDLELASTDLDLERAALWVGDRVLAVA